MLLDIDPHNNIVREVLLSLSDGEMEIKAVAHAWLSPRLRAGQWIAESTSSHGAMLAHSHCRHHSIAGEVPYEMLNSNTSPKL